MDIQSTTRLPTLLSVQHDCRQGTVRAVRFNVDGNYCMTAGSDKSVKLWNPYKRIHLNTYRSGNEVLDCCGSSDNSLILAGGRDKQPTIFDVETGKTLKRWRGHGGTVNAVAFNEDASVAISAGQDGFVCLHDVRSRGPPFQVLDEARDGVLCLDVNAYEIATGSADGNVRRYDIREGRLFVDFVKDPVTSVNLTADNQCLLVATMGSGVIRLFEKCNGQLLASYKGHQNRDFRIEAGILASNNEVLTGSEDGKVYIWDLVESTLIAKLEHPAGFKFVPSLSTHPKDPCILTASREKIFLWQCPE
uniref:WD repeat domain-containing protein 83 n=2 Tax=Meloidogyne TaxID=189290 RepID=A0A915PB97_9BILA